MENEEQKAEVLKRHKERLLEQMASQKFEFDKQNMGNEAFDANVRTHYKFLLDKIQTEKGSKTSLKFALIDAISKASNAVQRKPPPRQKAQEVEEIGQETDLVENDSLSLQIKHRLLEQDVFILRSRICYIEYYRKIFATSFDLSSKLEEIKLKSRNFCQIVDGMEKKVLERQRADDSRKNSLNLRKKDLNDIGDQLNAKVANQTLKFVDYGELKENLVKQNKHDSDLNAKLIMLTMGRKQSNETLIYNNHFDQLFKHLLRQNEKFILDIFDDFVCRKKPNERSASKSAEQEDQSMKCSSQFFTSDKIFDFDIGKLDSDFGMIARGQECRDGRPVADTFNRLTPQLKGDFIREIYKTLVEENDKTSKAAQFKYENIIWLGNVIKKLLAKISQRDAVCKKNTAKVEENPSVRLQPTQKLKNEVDIKLGIEKVLRS